ncbi:MAG TPA: LLM class F420-dependent oxidoreductase [Anaerolineaceae bacterium]|nr:LLM class F420-dependent oxidoreductase [Anaerolineaceae bacterium]
MARFRVGVQLHPQNTTYASFSEAVRQVEALGVDTIWTWDHFFPVYGDQDAPHFEGWTLLTAMAVLSQRAEIGCLVTCNSYRNPSLLADMARTVDHVSGGRLIFGIGAGWKRKDYAEYGYPFGTPASRLRDLGKALPVIFDRWAKLNPPPVRKIPVLIGGGGEKVTLKLAARYADIWNGFGPPESFRRKNEILDRWCGEIGRNAEEIERSVLLEGVSIPASLDEFVDARAAHVILELNDPWDFGLVERLVGWRENRG